VQLVQVEQVLHVQEVVLGGHWQDLQQPQVAALLLLLLAAALESVQQQGWQQQSQGLRLQRAALA
jgi:hypothetical protein